jgi:hypothetical protein
MYMVEENMAEEEKGFVIKDKRTFSSETEEAETPREDEEKKASVAGDETPEPEMEEQPETEEAFQLPDVSFSTFIFSLSSSALFHFGEVPDPTTGEKQKNLPMAKHTVDILGMLEEKTTGNLTDDEAQLLKNILYDLRMRYVKENA